MTTGIHIELAREPDATDLAAFLEDIGLTTVHAEPTAVDVVGTATRAEVGEAIAAWLEECDLPLVPAQVDREGFVLRPPTG